MLADDSPEFTIPELPPRSTLYSLEPAGIGTPEVESLSGYIARLAEAHCVSVFVLFRYLFGPLLKISTLFENDSGMRSKQTLSLNGTGVTAENFVRAAGSITMRGDLRLLTLLPWANAFPPSNLLKRERVWCPACYEEWLMLGRIIYEPLIWTLKAVEICTRHRRRLCSVCPHCGKTQSWLTNRSRPGHCSRCHDWLGGGEGSAQVEEVEGSLGEGKYLKWVAESIGSMLSASPRLTAQPTKERGTKSLSDCIKLIADGDVNAFAKLTGLYSSYIRLWLRGGQPQLPAILQICYRTDLGVVDYLTGSIDERKLTKKIDLQAKTKPRAVGPLKFVRATNWKAVGKYLAAILRSQKKPPTIAEIARRRNIPVAYLFQKFPTQCRAISLRRREYRFASEEAYLKAALKMTPPQPLQKISKGMGFIGARSLSKRHPELCRALSKRFSTFKREEMMVRKKEHYDEVRNVALMLHEQGIYPSFERVAERLTVPSRLAKADMRNMLREVQSELGFRKLTSE